MEEDFKEKEEQASEKAKAKKIGREVPSTTISAMGDFPLLWFSKKLD